MGLLRTRQAHFAAILILVLTGCKPGSSEKGPTGDSLASAATTPTSFKGEGRFAVFLSSLEALHTPLTLDCGIQGDLHSRHRAHEDAALQSFYPRELVIGRLWSTSSYVAVLYGSIGDWVYPAIFTFDQTGRPIDSLDLRVYCEGEPGSRGSSVAYIADDRTITAVDTVWTTSLDSLHNEIQGTDSTFVQSQVFRVDSLGRIDSVNKSRLRIFPR
jgi:hypothetical protein